MVYYYCFFFGGAFLECKKRTFEVVITGGFNNESKDYIGMQRMQAEKLRHSKEQEKYSRQT